MDKERGVVTLIDREAALGVLDVWAAPYLKYEMEARKAGRGFPEYFKSKADYVLCIKRDIAALPAIGTCANCAVGGTITGRRDLVSCTVCGAHSPDFFCSAWKAKETTDASRP